jgi:hypothetical protein
MSNNYHASILGHQCGHQLVHVSMSLAMARLGELLLAAAAGERGYGQFPVANGYGGERR